MLSIGTIAAKIFGSSNDRKVKTYRPRVDAINALEPELAALSDVELKARTAMLSKRSGGRTTAKASTSAAPACASTPPAGWRKLPPGWRRNE